MSAINCELGFVVLAAEDAYKPSVVLPPADPRLSPQWEVVGVIDGVDAVFGPGKMFLIDPRREFYGWVLHQPGFGYLVVIRGTQSILEFVIDGEAQQEDATQWMPNPSAHPIAGKVEKGFWDLYQTLQVAGQPLADFVIKGCAREPITVAGHSLGSAQATYLVLDIAKALGPQAVHGLFFASPRPGDKEFSVAFGKAAPQHVMYANVNDIVPRVPFWFEYADVPNTIALECNAGVHIKGGIAAQHHILTYAALIDKQSLKKFQPLPCDQADLANIIIS